MKELSEDYFSLLGLPVAFDIDQDLLSQNYRNLQQAAHPDKHAAASSTEKMLAMQLTARANEAHQTLKDLLARAGYLLELKGINIKDDRNTAMDPMFLMEQIELREQLSTLRDVSEPFVVLEGIEANIVNSLKSLTDGFRNAYEAEKLGEAYDVVRKMQFIYKLRQEAGDISADLEDELL